MQTASAVRGNKKSDASPGALVIKGGIFERNGDTLRICSTHELNEKTLRSDWSLGEEVITLPESWSFSVSKACSLPQIRLGSVCFKSLLYHDGVSYEERLALAEKCSLEPLDVRFMEFFYRNQQLIPGKIKGNILFPGIDILGPTGHHPVPCLTREKEWWAKSAACIDRGYISEDDVFALVRNIKTPASF